LTYLLSRPWALVDARIETIIPPLPTLVAVSGPDCLGNLAPSGAVELNGLAQLLVLLAHPRTLAYCVGDAVVPALPAVLVVAPGEVGCNLVPADRAVIGGLYRSVSV
jgi:hypothetical protein